MDHDVCLNIYYDAPDEVWKKIYEVYRSMPCWDEGAGFPHWCGSGTDICASVEPGGIQISGTMPKDKWDEWYAVLKRKLTEALGYEIGEPEDGFGFRYWKPFVKRYTDIKSVDDKKIVFSRGESFYFSMFSKADADLKAEPPVFILSSELIELDVILENKDVRNERLFGDLLSKIKKYGIKTALI